ncbi:MAG: winged helix-turn-helix transcriptional regulator [Reyranellaceae bacterium]
MAGKGPLPGRKVRGSTSGRPIMAALDLAGRRWLLRILWELRAEALTFRALRARCGGISPTVLNARLGEMRQAGLLDSTAAGYRLTPRGLELIEALVPLTRWAERWAKESGK